jgi:transposase
MTSPSNDSLAAHRSAVEQLASERYSSGSNAAQIEELAVAAGDCEYLMARIRQLDAEREHASVQLPWLSPTRSGSAKEALKRINAICQAFPDLFSAMLVVVATHQSAPREALAATVRQLRPDAAELTQADVEGLLASIVTGGRQAFDAVLRTRKSAKRTTAPLAWVKNDD